MSSRGGLAPASGQLLCVRGCTIGSAAATHDGNGARDTMMSYNIAGEGSRPKRVAHKIRTTPTTEKERRGRRRLVGGLRQRRGRRRHPGKLYTSALGAVDPINRKKRRIRPRESEDERTVASRRMAGNCDELPCDDDVTRSTS